MDAYYVQSESTHTSTNYPFIKFINKPVMIYYFVDPFCYDCWSLEASIKKMTMKYGALFNVRPIISHLFNEIRTSDRIVPNHWDRYYVSLGIKAAALQGNKVGRDFLRNIQETIFLYDSSEDIESILFNAAKYVGVDLNEFQDDFFASSTKNAYQGDMQLTQEMEVKQYPTLVFFSQYIEDYSIKISGLQSYETYTYILKKMLQSNTDTTKQNIPPLEIFLKNYSRVKVEEVAFIFDLSINDAEKKLKELQLNQKVKKMEVNGKIVWEYID